MEDIRPNRISMEGIEWKYGTDKQIDWAERLVRGLIKGANTYLEREVTKGQITDEEKDVVLISLDKNIIKNNDASWWIDNREEPILTKLEDICFSDPEAYKILQKTAY